MNLTVLSSCVLLQFYTLAVWQYRGEGWCPGRSGHVHGVKYTEGRHMEGGVQVLKDDSTSHCMAARDTV